VGSCAATCRGAKLSASQAEQTIQRDLDDQPRTRGALYALAEARSTSARASADCGLVPIRCTPALVAKRSAQFWLMKTEPDVYSIDDLARERVGTWEGVRSYQARNFMRAMKLGDLALFYHSNAAPPGVIGAMRICKEVYVDPTQFDPESDYYDPQSKPEAPRWDRVEVEFVEKFPRLVSLEQLKADPACSEMLVIRRGQRLSVQPVARKDFQRVLKLAGAALKLARAS
jgi:predicted RNA-binding protein with PUA-like domain